ncbi:GatB/YqeY domain-containing protein [Candidatus Woesebacteria bacterium]|nr:GatB/YqeY domain-containing protein [Candidatus Woesebacteria bacterium]
MIADEIRQQITAAMKAGDRLRVDTLKMLSASLTNAEIAKKREKLTEDEEIKIVRGEIGKRKDAIELYEKGGAKEKAEKEKKEIQILEDYLPKQMTDEKLTEMVDDAIKQTGASAISDMGKVIGFVMKKAGTSVDGQRVSALVRSKLS